mmetsp:Transcript_60570/g.174751  ORF Transcript_60570/g.174751 Transcript_60570/m.174751 type:complete len:237 (+) Transcript_60570:1439-2149(+)
MPPVEGHGGGHPGGEHLEDHGHVERAQACAVRGHRQRGGLRHGVHRGGERLDGEHDREVVAARASSASGSAGARGPEAAAVGRGRVHGVRRAGGGGALPDGAAALAGELARREGGRAGAGAALRVVGAGVMHRVRGAQDLDPEAYRGAWLAAAAHVASDAQGDHPRAAAQGRRRRAAAGRHADAQGQLRGRRRAGRARRRCLHGCCAARGPRRLGAVPGSTGGDEDFRHAMRAAPS